jgi:hypothetical protein
VVIAKTGRTANVLGKKMTTRKLFIIVTYANREYKAKEAPFWSGVSQHDEEMDSICRYQSLFGCGQPELMTSINDQIESQEGKSPYEHIVLTDIVLTGFD